MDRDSHEVLKKIEEHQAMIQQQLERIAAALENLVELQLRDQQR